MPYSTKQNLLNRPNGEQELIQLTDVAGTGLVNDTVLNQAMAAAFAELNSYLAMYALPLTVVPDNFPSLEDDITIYRLYGTRVIDPVAERYKAAIRYLERVANGSVSLAANAAGTTQPVADGLEFVTAASVFSQAALSDY